MQSWLESLSDRTLFTLPTIDSLSAGGASIDATNHDDIMRDTEKTMISGSTDLEPEVEWDLCDKGESLTSKVQFKFAELSPSWCTGLKSL